MADKITVSDMNKMKVVDLKKALKERNLPLTGTKQELLDRLTASVAEEDSVLDESTSSKDTPVTTQPPVETEQKTEEVIPAKITSQVSTEESTEVKAVTSPTLSNAERIKQRAERFGVVNEDMKKQLRAERFGVSSGNSKLSTAGTGADVDALKKRAERFGQVTSSALTKVDEAEKIRKRKERFGDVITSAANNSPKIAKITFSSEAKVPVSSEEEERKKKRAERFGLSS